MTDILQYTPLTLTELHRTYYRSIIIIVNFGQKIMFTVYEYVLNKHTELSIQGHDKTTAKIINIIVHC